MCVVEAPPGEPVRVSLDERRFRDLFLNAPVALLLVGPGGEIIEANDAAAALLGYPGPDLTAMTLAEMAIDSALLVEPLELLRREAEVREFGVTLRAGDGSPRILSVCTAVRRSPEGQLVTSQWALRDAAAPSHAEQVAELLAAIVDSSSDAIVSKQLDGTIMSWNRAAERLFGYSADETVGRSIRMIVPPDRQAEEDDILRRLQRGEVVDHFETVRMRKDGSLIEVSVTISPVRNREGKIIGASKVARDISEQKRAEEELHQSLAAKDDFLGLVSHELRTPLTTVKGTANVLRRHEAVLSAADRDQALMDIEGGADQMLRIVENMLTLARAENMKGDELEPVLLGRLASQLVDERRRQLTRHNVQYEESASPAPVLANPGYLRLILTNLLNNAAKYSPRGSDIVVRVESGEGEASLLVEDAGIGVAEDELDAVFTPFFRSPRARAEASGIGLGLTVCKRLAEIQHGSISVFPRPGGGSIFRVTLPLMDEQAG
jgi:PAS domain S-box-containing protein